MQSLLQDQVEHCLGIVTKQKGRQEELTEQVPGLPHRTMFPNSFIYEPPYFKYPLYQYLLNSLP